MTKSGTSRSYASSPCSAQSTVSRSKAERNPLKAAGKLYKGLLALEEIDVERAYDSQSMQRLYAEKAQDTSKLQEAITARDKALGENQRLKRELLGAGVISRHYTGPGLMVRYPAGLASNAQRASIGDYSVLEYNRRPPEP
ncbi:hypothetical protein N7527_006468 [Penicillium freii]|nr:hypothetical protein N7527_006468 [Penicillium freii]